MESSNAELKKRIVELEVLLEQSNEEQTELIAKAERSHEKYLTLKDKLVSEEKAWREKWRKADSERRKLEIDLSESDKIVIEAEAEAGRLRGLIDGKDDEIRVLQDNAKTEKDEEKVRMGKACKRIKDLVCEKRALEEMSRKAAEEYDRKVSELVSRLEEVERGIEAEDMGENRGFMEKMEWIKMEKMELNDRTWKQIEKEIMGSNFVNSTAALRNQQGSSVKKDIRTSKGKLKWESCVEMLNDLTEDDELCMRSVCALYRKHNSLGSWKNGSSSTDTAFQPIFETMGMNLGELLTNQDPQGRMMKSLAEFKLVNPKSLEECRLVAWNHNTELFEIYKNNLDPLFMPDERCDHLV